MSNLDRLCIDMVEDLNNPTPVALRLRELLMKESPWDEDDGNPQVTGHNIFTDQRPFPRDDSTTRTFPTGATRDTAEGKLDYEGCLSPLVLKRYAEYMRDCTWMPDGGIRSSDNWQKGMPLDVYMKSAWRHFMILWHSHRRGIKDVLIEYALLGLLFNVMGYLHELLKEKGNETYM